KSAEVNLLAKTMVCEYDGRILNENAIILAVEKAGFSATPNSHKRTKSASPPKKSDGFTNVKTRLIVSIFFLAPLMYIAMGHMLGLPLTEAFHRPQNAVAFGLTQFLLSLPVVYVNRKFFFSGFKALKNRSPNMDSLVAVGSSAALAYGVFSIYMMGYGLGIKNLPLVERYMSNLYFESAVMILTLVTVGKFLEERSKSKTDSAIAKLLDLSPKTASVLRNELETIVPVEELALGDIIIIKPGEKIPVDGIILFGSSSVDQSALTGESIPIDKTVGDSIMSASINLNGFLKMKATKVGKDTTLAHIIELVENASGSKAPIARLADKVSGIFVPSVMAIAVATTVAWLAFGYTFEFALGLGISVLVVSCPCALGLATPVAIMVAMGRSASNGILVKNAESLELLHSVDTVVLDKTGTITVGKPSVTDIVALIDENQFVKIAVSIENNSEHPLSKAICDYKKGIELHNTTDFKAIFGKGITAKIGGVNYYAGNKSYMDELSVDVGTLAERANQLATGGKTPIFFAKETNLI
ncbi:MAG: heavy metal translocating P-type ATPase, partial [Clostridia bacterium]